MRKIYKFLFPVLSLVFMLGAQDARASHVMGSDITWKCLGGDTFLVTVTAYRDCNGIPLDGTNLHATTSEGCASQIKTVSGASKCCGKDITPVCQKSCTRCTDLSCDFQFGIQQWTITAKFVLPPGCCNYSFNWEECCRNGAITTLSPGDFYSEVTCNRCIKNPCDNSPYFTSPPVGIFCVDQCVVYNPGANDDDRDVNGNADSLVYSFGDPLSGPGAAYSYYSPYTNKTPLIYTGDDPDATFTPPLCAGFHLDPVTGDIEFRATKTDVTVMVQVVDEYRKDSLGIERKIGTIRRDLQISIIDCPENHAPVITGINGGTSTSMKICADQQTCFTIQAFDIDPKDSVTMSWNNQITGASFTIVDKTKKWPKGIFCWRPKKSDVRSYPYHFIITALDNACPVPGRASRSFSLYVIASPEAVYSAKLQSCGVVDFQADVAASSATAITDYVWTGEGAPGYGPLFIHAKKGSYQYTRPGTYHYTLAVTGPNGCTATYTDSVKIPQFAQISLPRDTTVCEKSLPITLTATPAFAVKPYTTWWDNTSPVNNTLSLTSKIVKDTVFVVHIKDATGCTNYDSMRVKMQKLPKPNIGPDKRGCWGHDIMLTTGLPHMQSAFWTKMKGGDTARNFLQGDTVYVQDSGVYAVSVMDSFGCPGHDSVNVFYNPLVKVTPTDTNTCVGDSVLLNAGFAGADATFKWIDEIHQWVVGTGRTYKFKGTNTLNAYKFLVVINQTRNGVTCIDSGEKTVRVHEFPKPSLKPLPDKCIDDNAFSLNTFVDQAHQGGTWFYPPNPSAVVSNYLYPSVMGITAGDPNAGWVHYLYADAYRCPSDDSVRINISTLPQVSAGHDSEICRANGRFILSNGYVAPGGGQWYAAPGTPASAIQYSSFRDTVFFDPANAPIDTVYGVVYKVKYTTGTATCNNSDTVHLRVKTNPTIIMPVIDSLCDNGDAVQLPAQPGGGVFEFQDATNPAALSFDQQSNTYFFNPDSAGGGFHNLKYTAWADPQRKLCSTSDSMRIYVVPKPNPVSFTTEDKQWEYCISHAPVKLVPNKNWPGGQFYGSGVYNIGNTFYFNPMGSNANPVDTTDSNKNVIYYQVPYNGTKCHVTVSHKIGVDGRPLVIIDKSSKYQCDGVTSFDLSAKVYNCTTLQWSSPGGNNIIGSNPVNNVATANYAPTQPQLKARHFWIYLTGSNNGKCVPSTDSVEITINPKPEPNFTADTVGCEPLTVQFHSSYKPLPKGYSVDSYDWDFGDGSAHSTEPNPLHVYTVANDSNQQHFNVTLTLQTAVYKCSGVATKTGYIEVFATPKPKIFADPQFTTIAVPQVQFDIDSKLSKGVDIKDPNTTYTWSFGDSSQNSFTRNPQHTYKDTGSFKVYLYVKSKDCIGIDSTTIVIKPELIIFIPNVFKPDNKHGDGRIHGDNHFAATENNTFQPVISDNASFEMSIYNRWGELMYSTTDPNKGWDGKYQGHLPVEDVYVYVIKATSYSGKPYTFTGTVTLLY